MNEKIKVLIGDDSRDFGALWANLLKDGGMYAVTRKNCGRILLNEIKKEFPDILIVNILMQDMSAAELIACLRKQIGRLPIIIAVSEYASSFLEREIINSGADCVISLPIEPEDVARKVKSAYRFRHGGSGDRSGQEFVNLEFTVTDTMHKMGMPAHVKGYYYVREGIMLAVSDVGILDSMTKELYPAIAEQFNTTAQRVERAIRHVIEITWEKGNSDFLKEIFGICQRRPTNSEFIAMIADRLRMKYSYGRRL